MNGIRSQRVNKNINNQTREKMKSKNKIQINRIINENVYNNKIDKYHRI